MFLDSCKGGAAGAYKAERWGTYPARPLLVELANLAQLLVQFSVQCEFQHDEDTLRVVEVAIHA